MSRPAAPLWTAQQQAWLRALGHEVPVLVGDAANEASEPAERDRGGDAASTRIAQPGTATVALAVPAESSLLHALARAAARPASDPELLAALPALDSLRGSPAARKALWPRLRALRRRKDP